MSHIKRPKLEGYVSTAEASQILGCTQRRVQQLCREGAFERVWISERWLIKRASLEAYKKRE